MCLPSQQCSFSTPSNQTAQSAVVSAEQKIQHGDDKVPLNESIIINDQLHETLKSAASAGTPSQNPGTLSWIQIFVIHVTSDPFVRLNGSASQRRPARHFLDELSFSLYVRHLLAYNSPSHDLHALLPVQVVWFG